MPSCASRAVKRFIGVHLLRALCLAFLGFGNRCESSLDFRSTTLCIDPQPLNGRTVLFSDAKVSDSNPYVDQGVQGSLVGICAPTAAPTPVCCRALPCPVSSTFRSQISSGADSSTINDCSVLRHARVLEVCPGYGQRYCSEAFDNGLRF